MSRYFEKFRDKYLDTLSYVEKNSKNEVWIKFLILAIKEQAKDTQNLIEKIKSLYKEIHVKLEKVKSPYTAKTIDFIFKNPAFKASSLRKFINSSRATSLRIIEKMQDFGLVESYLPPDRKRKIFIFTDLINLLQNW